MGPGLEKRFGAGLFVRDSLMAKAALPSEKSVSLRLGGGRGEGPWWGLSIIEVLA